MIDDGREIVEPLVESGLRGIQILFRKRSKDVSFLVSDRPRQRGLNQRQFSFSHAGGRVFGLQHPSQHSPHPPDILRVPFNLMADRADHFPKVIKLDLAAAFQIIIFLGLPVITDPRELFRLF